MASSIFPIFVPSNRYSRAHLRAGAQPGRWSVPGFTARPKEKVRPHVSRPGRSDPRRASGLGVFRVRGWCVSPPTRRRRSRFRQVRTETALTAVIFVVWMILFGGGGYLVIVFAIRTPQSHNVARHDDPPFEE